MIFDQQQTTFLQGALVFQEFVFANLPMQPGQVKETIQLQGSQGPKSLNLQGSVSSPASLPGIYFPGT